MNKLFNRYLSSAAVYAANNEAGNGTGKDVAVISEEKPDETGSTEADQGGFDGEAAVARAKELAGKENKEMSAAITRVMEAKEDWQGGPIKVLFAMKEAYEDALDDFPEPDSDTGNNRDKFKIPVRRGDKETTAPTTFYTQFADATKEGKEIVETLGYLKRLANVEARKDDIPQELLNLTDTQRIAMESKLAGRRATIRGSYKKAMQLYFQMQAVESLKHVNVDFVYQTEDGEPTNEVENTREPIIVWEKPADGKPITKSRYVSIGSFLKFDAKKASEKGGTLKALEDTVSRSTGGKAGDKGKETDGGQIKSVDTFVGRFVETFRFMDEMQMAKDNKDIGKLYQIINAKGSDELAVAIVEMRNYLDDICKDAKLDVRYTKLQQAGSELVTEKTKAA